MHHKHKTSRSNKVPQKNEMVFRVEHNALLMAFLIEKLPHKSRNKIKSLLHNKQVLVDDVVVSQFNHPLVRNQKVEISSGRSRGEPAAAGSAFTIVFEDDQLIVIDKSNGLLSVATQKEKRLTAFSLLSEYVKQTDAHSKIFIVHRLDRDTSGLMVFAKNEEVKNLLQEGWKRAEVEKKYVALVEGKTEKPQGTIISYLSEDKNFKVHSSQKPQKGQKALTHFSELASNGMFSLLEVNLETGRKNQIRVHMEDMGHSIVGDKKYGAVSNPIRRLGLHAQKLAFTHPVSGEKLRFETKIPPAFLLLVKGKK